MPEGPSLVILREVIERFKGKTITDAWGSGSVEMSKLIGRRITGFRTLGKQLFIYVKGTVVRIHLLMFGTYSIDEQNRPDSRVRLALTFSKGSIYFYTCKVSEVAGDPEVIYDWQSDVMSELWNPRKARKKLKDVGDNQVCDVLLDQNIFAGVGNIIKNEVLYRIRLHPETPVKNIPPARVSAMIRESRIYSFQFLDWKKEGVLKRHWLAHTKKVCGRCSLPFIKKYTGKAKRRSFFCTNCQVLY